MGYRLRLWRTDGLGDDRTVEIEGIRALEATMEGLNPWTHYQAQIQAYNSIGPGPWSSTLAVMTVESGMNYGGYTELGGDRVSCLELTEASLYVFSRTCVCLIHPCSEI